MPPLPQILASIARAFAPTPESWVFVGAIWLLAVIALFIAARQGLALKPERQELEEARQKTPAASEQSEVEKWRQTLGESSLVAKYANVLWEIRQTAQPDLSAVLSTVSQQSAATLAFARLVPNLTMLVGLMGTVVGLAHVVQALGPQIITSSQANDPQKMAQDIAGQMGQLQTAFACTVNGIFAAVLVAIGVNFVERKQNVLLAALDDFGVSVLAPRILPPAPMEVLVRTLQKSSDLVEYITLTMSKATGEFTAQVSKFNEITSAANSNFEAIANDVNTSAVQLARSSGQLSESVGLLGKVQVEMHNIYTNLVQKHETAEATFVSQTNSVIGKMDSLQTGFNTNTQSIIERMQSASDNYAESTSAFQEASGNFRNMSLEIATGINDAVKDNLQKIVDVGEVYQQAVEGIDGGLRDVLAAVRDLMTRLDPRLLPREEWERTAFALDRVGRVAEQILKTPAAQEMASQSGGALDTYDLLQSLERLQQTWQSAAGQQSALIVQQNETAQQWAQERNDALTLLLDQVAGVEQQLAAQNRALNGLNATVANGLDTAVVRVSSLLASQRQEENRQEENSAGRQTIPARSVEQAVLNNAALPRPETNRSVTEQAMLATLQSIHEEMQAIRQSLASPLRPSWWRKLAAKERPRQNQSTLGAEAVVTERPRTQPVSEHIASEPNTERSSEHNGKEPVAAHNGKEPLAAEEALVPAHSDENAAWWKDGEGRK